MFFANAVLLFFLGRFLKIQLDAHAANLNLELNQEKLGL